MKFDKLEEKIQKSLTIVGDLNTLSPVIYMISRLKISKDVECHQPTASHCHLYNTPPNRSSVLSSTHRIFIKADFILGQKINLNKFKTTEVTQNRSLTIIDLTWKSVTER